ncbi:hypothetical protein M9Y10_009028 [Tritrichomonas musculus]|uniref:HAT C-terminal dimerisation domain-containing protein n=1 Tax=Tritrichomonas musculus TaxID=1915356 RepID=A0ABR2IZR4_9EUKA
MLKVIKPIVNFTISVQKNFVNIGTVYWNLLNLYDELNTLINEEDTFGFISIVKENFIIRFNEAGDSTLAEISFLLTSKGREWYQSKCNIANNIFFKISRKKNILNEEQIFLNEFNVEKRLLIEKLNELSIYLRLDSQTVVQSFFIWLSSNDLYYQEPIDYWKTNLTSQFEVNNSIISYKDLSLIAIHILVIPGTEAICERCFSQLKLIHSHFRSTLKSDILDSLLQIKLTLLWSNETNPLDLLIEDDEYNEEQSDNE